METWLRKAPPENSTSGKLFHRCLPSRIVACTSSSATNSSSRDRASSMPSDAWSQYCSRRQDEQVNSRPSPLHDEISRTHRLLDRGNDRNPVSARGRRTRGRCVRVYSPTAGGTHKAKGVGFSQR